MTVELASDWLIANLGTVISVSVQRLLKSDAQSIL